jgi:hypothetical protein
MNADERWRSQRLREMLREHDGTWSTKRPDGDGARVATIVFVTDDLDDPPSIHRRLTGGETLAHAVREYARGIQDDLPESVTLDAYVLDDSGPHTEDFTMTLEAKSVDEDDEDDGYSTDPGKYRLEFPIGSRVRFCTMFGAKYGDGRTGTVAAFRYRGPYSRGHYRVRWDDGGEEDDIPAKVLTSI